MSQAKGKQKQSLRAAKGKKNKVQRIVWIGGDEEIYSRLRDLEAQRKRLEAVFGMKAEQTPQEKQRLDSIDAQIKEAQEEFQATAIRFVMQAIGRNRYDALLKDHPPTPEQIEEAKKDGENISFNPDTFSFALIDACCVEPEHEPGELEAWLRDDPDEEWNMAEVADLFQAAVMVNVDRSRTDMGKGFKLIPS